MYYLSENSWVKVWEEKVDIDFDKLWELHPPSRGIFKLYGKIISVSRWEETYLFPYTFGKIDRPAQPLPDLLKPIYKHVNNTIGEYNQVMCVWYDSGDYIGSHSDNTKPLVPQSDILTISLGAPRLFRLRNKEDNSIALDIEVHQNLFLIMGGMCQEEFKHEIVKTKKPTGKRISITFRLFKT